MSDYLVYGKKGNGKSLICVGRIRDALLAGKPVATNLDLRLENLLPHGLRNVRCYRLPDRPTIDDLNALGRGSDKIDESSYGLIVLDEGATMLNARSYNDKGRKEMLDYFVHSRKLGWDTYFICQNPVQMDKQVRESLIELTVACKRLDKVRIPFIGVLTKNLLGFELRPPKVHVATVRYGQGNEAMVSDRWVYTGTSLYEGYDTRQVFREDYPHGLFCCLSPWHVAGRVHGVKLRPSERLRAWLRSWRHPAAPAREAKPRSPLLDLLEKLPPDQRIVHFKRLNALGAL